MQTDTLTLPKETNGNDDVPKKHLIRYSERRFDGTVETLCGLIRTPKPPRDNAEKCEKCLEVEKAISFLNSM